ncbi:DUF1579 domain-containing protein [bacterium]|nr:DUF1579 domain-containing protein [bacterium]MCI0612335.1 DUF1579 domain-containing protein [bacterium]
MKKSIYLIILMLLAPLVYAQTPPAQPAPPATPAPAASTSGKTLPELLNWMMGEWEGEGTSRSEKEFIGKLSVIQELDATAILIHRESTTKEGLTGGLKELMIVGYDGTTKKIVGTVYDNKNTIALYVGELKSANELAFNSATAQQGYVSRRTFKSMPDGALSFVIEGAAPGKEVSKAVEINFKKKS